MSEYGYKDVLERIGERVPMPEPAFDRMVGRRERRSRNRRVSAGVLGAIVAAALVLALANFQPVEAPRPATTPTRSASNGWIAYTLPEGVRGERGGIYFVAEGQEPQLAIGTPGDGASELCPTFSPDGPRIAFTRAKEPSTAAVFVADVDGPGVVRGSERRVAVGGGSDWPCPEWSPDSKGLLYADTAGLRFVGVETGEPAVLIRTGTDPFDVEWSPDGSMVAVASRDGAIWIVSARDGAVVTNAYGPAGGRLSWSPGGDRIAMGQAGWEEESSVRLIDVDTGEVEDLTASGRTFDGYGAPSWSPDGTSIALRDEYGVDNGIVVVRPQDDSWYRVALPPVVAPLGGRLEVWGMRWSPDGQRLLVASGCSVHSIAADGSGGAILLSSPNVDPQACLRPPGSDWQALSR